MKAILLALALFLGFASANDDAENFFEALVQESRVVECPALTHCRIRCHNLNPENDRKFNQCVKRNCTDPGVCVEE